LIYGADSLAGSVHDLDLFGLCRHTPHGGSSFLASSTTSMVTEVKASLHPPNDVFITELFASSSWAEQSELHRIYLPGTSVNRGRPFTGSRYRHPIKNDAGYLALALS
jgi:hypothetical protein